MSFARLCMDGNRTCQQNNMFVFVVFVFASRLSQRHPLDYEGSVCLSVGDPRPNAQALPLPVLGGGQGCRHGLRDGVYRNKPLWDLYELVFLHIK